MSATIPQDDLLRKLVVADPESSEVQHIGLAGNAYTVTVSGKDTNGAYCVIDMLVAPGGGPAPHRHDFEESFIVLEGEIEATFRGETATVKAPQTIHIPANAPHFFRNATKEQARLLCICSPAGQEEFFAQIGVPVATRTSFPPPMSDEEKNATIEKAARLAPEYRTEMLK